MLLLALRPCSVVSLGLLARLGSLLVRVWVLRQLRRILGGLLRRLLLLRRVRFAVFCRSSAGSVLLGVVAHVAKLLRVLAVG